MGQCCGKIQPMSPVSQARLSLGTKSLRSKNFKDPDLMLIGVSAMGFSERDAVLITNEAQKAIEEKNQQKKAFDPTKYSYFLTSAVNSWKNSKKREALECLGHGYAHLLFLEKSSQKRIRPLVSRSEYFTQFIEMTSYASVLKKPQGKTFFLSVSSSTKENSDLSSFKNSESQRKKAHFSS